MKTIPTLARKFVRECSTDAMLNFLLAAGARVTIRVNPKNQCEGDMGLRSVRCEIYVLEKEPTGDDGNRREVRRYGAGSTNNTREAVADALVAFIFGEKLTPDKMSFQDVPRTVIDVYHEAHAEQLGYDEETVRMVGQENSSWSDKKTITLPPPEKSSRQTHIKGISKADYPTPD